MPVRKRKSFEKRSASRINYSGSRSSNNSGAKGVKTKVKGENSVVRISKRDNPSTSHMASGKKVMPKKAPPSTASKRTPPVKAYFQKMVSKAKENYGMPYKAYGASPPKSTARPATPKSTPKPKQAKSPTRSMPSSIRGVIQSQIKPNRNKGKTVKRSTRRVGGAMSRINPNRKR